MSGIDHAQASMLVPDMIRGGLTDSEKREVMAHMASCADCRALAETYELMRDTLRGSEAAILSEHPGSHEIVALALGTGALAPEALLRVSAHVRDCATCLDEVETTRLAGEAAKTAPSSPTGRAPTFQGSWFLRRHGLAALAAGLVVAALGYPAYLGLWKTPRLAEEVRSLQSEREALRERVEDLDRSLGKTRSELDRATTWSGAVDYVLLLGRGRGGSETETLHIREGQPYAPIAIQPAAPVGDAARPHRIEILTQDGAPVWSWRTTGGELRRLLKQSDTILLQVPAKSLPAGPYILRVVPEGQHERVPLLEQRLVVVLD